MQKITPYLWFNRQAEEDKDAEKAKRVMQAMLQMTKIDIQALRRAHDQK